MSGNYSKGAGCGIQALNEGDILVWEVKAAGRKTAAEVVTEMGHLADEYSLGSWNGAEIGLGTDRAYFDLTLNRNIDELRLKLIFGSSPLVY